MKLAIIYNKDDHKLSLQSYSQTYRHMFDALIERFDKVQRVTENCSAKDIEADVIIIFDVHSSHHIEIENLTNHKALKYSYLNDPHQLDMNGMYKDRTPVRKLGAKNRVKRLLERGVRYIICPYQDGYFKFIAPHVEAFGIHPEKTLVWFPVAPRNPNGTTQTALKPISQRRGLVIGNGHVWKGMKGFRPYELRRWAYQQPSVDYIKHCLDDPRVPKGSMFTYLLRNWAAALALTDWYVVPKYLEIPMAGCLCIAQEQPDYVRMGFKDGENCLFVSQKNFNSVIRGVKEDISFYQSIADAGRKLAENKYTDKHFADYIYNHARRKLGI